MLQVITLKIKYGDYEYATINSVVIKNFDSRFEVICLKILAQHGQLNPRCLGVMSVRYPMLIFGALPVFFIVGLGIPITHSVQDV